MTITLRNGLDDLNFLVGADFPEADEDALWRIARAWAVAAADLRQLAPEALDAGEQVARALGGETGVAFAQLWRRFAATDGFADRLATACEALASACDNAALEIEYAKIQYIAALVVLGITLAALAAAIWAGGVSALGIPVAIAAAQVTIRVILMRLITAVAIGAVLNLAIDGVAQAVQMGLGHRADWDWAKSTRAAEDGAIFGAAGGGVVLAGSRFAPGAMSTVAGLAGAAGVTGAVGGVAAPAAHGEMPTSRDFVLALTSGIAGGLGPDLAMGRAARPDLSGLSALGTAGVDQGAAGVLAVSGADVGSVADGSTGAVRSTMDSAGAGANLDGRADLAAAGQWSGHDRAGSLALDQQAGRSPGEPATPGAQSVLAGGAAELAAPPGRAGVVVPAERPAGVAAPADPAGAVPIAPSGLIAGPAPATPAATAPPGASAGAAVATNPAAPAQATPLAAPTQAAQLSVPTQAAQPAAPAPTAPGGAPAPTAPGGGPVQPGPPGVPVRVAYGHHSQPAGSSATAVVPVGPEVVLGAAFATAPDAGTVPVPGEPADRPEPDGADGAARAITDEEAIELVRTTAFETDAGLAFYTVDDEIRDFARAVHPTDGFVTLDLHGSPDGFQIDDAAMTPWQFAMALRELQAAGVLQVPEGVGIKLLSCDTAVGGDVSPAARLARELGVDVVAPDQPVWTTLDGDEVVASPVLVGGVVMPADPPDGEWHLFAAAPTGSLAPVAGDGTNGGLGSVVHSGLSERGPPVHVGHDAGGSDRGEPAANREEHPAARGGVSGGRDGSRPDAGR